MKVLSEQKRALLDRLGRLIEQSQSTELTISDESGYFSVDDDIVRDIRELVRHTADLMREIMECYDADVEVEDSEEISATDDEAFLKEIGAQIASQMAVEEVSGLAFVSRGQLLDVLEAIDNAVESRHVWKVASNVDTGQRRSGRALVAIESAIRECEGLPVGYRPWQDLDDSLEVRRLYGDFRRAILHGDEPDRVPAGEELVAALRRAAESIAKLRGLDIYPYLRIDDRLQIRRLQKRIVEWLEGAAPDHEAGARLWGDLVSFARLLGQINLRQEIREHDRLAVAGLYRRFFGSGEVPTKLDSDSLALLEPLLGREEDLDRIILAPERCSVKDLKEPLERLRKELGKPFDSQPLADFLHPVHG